MSDTETIGYLMFGESETSCYQDVFGLVWRQLFLVKEPISGRIIH